MTGRTGQAIIAALLLVLGGVWVFQGIGVLGGSPMTGVTFWAWAGVVSLIAGVVLLARVIRNG